MFFLIGPIILSFNQFNTCKRPPIPNSSVFILRGLFLNCISTFNCIVLCIRVCLQHFISKDFCLLNTNTHTPYINEPQAKGDLKPQAATEIWMFEFQSVAQAGANTLPLTEPTRAQRQCCAGRGGGQLIIGSYWFRQTGFGHFDFQHDRRGKQLPQSQICGPARHQILWLFSAQQLTVRLRFKKEVSSQHSSLNIQGLERRSVFKWGHIPSS